MIIFLCPEYIRDEPALRHGMSMNSEKDREYPYPCQVKRWTGKDCVDKFPDFLHNFAREQHHTCIIPMCRHILPLLNEMSECSTPEVRIYRLGNDPNFVFIGSDIPYVTANFNPI